MNPFMGQKKVTVPQDVAEFALESIQARLERHRQGKLQLTSSADVAELERHEFTLKQCLKDAEF